jgi:hypothetical protein
MMLVLGMLAAVTVLTAAAITSQQNAPDTGLNAAADVQARWSAESAANLAVAVLETNYDFSGLNAEMMADQLVASGLANVKVTTPDGRIPTPDDRELMLTATSTVNGVTREIQKRVSLTPAVPIDQAADPLLKEFGIAAADGLYLDDTVKITTWGLSPASGSTKPVSVASLASTGSNVAMGASPSLSRIALFVGANADAGFAAKITSMTYAAGGRQLPYTIPAVPEIAPAVFSSLPTATASEVQVSGTGTNVTLPTGGKYASLRVESGATVRLSAANGTHYSFDELRIESKGTLIIEGAVLVEVRSGARVKDQSAITFAGDTSALALFTKADVEIVDSGVGVPLAVAQDTARRPAGLTSYTNPNRLRIFPQPASAGGSSSPTITIDKKSMVVGCIHAPTGRVDVKDSSCVFGRMTGYDVRMSQNAVLLYDPALDPNTGFTNSKSALFDATGAAIPQVATALATVNPAGGTSLFKATMTSVKGVLSAVAVAEDGPAVTATLSGAVTARATRLAEVKPVECDDDRNNDLVADKQEVAP